MESEQPPDVNVIGIIVGVDIHGLVGADHPKPIEAVAAKLHLQRLAVCVGKLVAHGAHIAKCAAGLAPAMRGLDGDGGGGGGWAGVGKEVTQEECGDGDGRYGDRKGRAQAVRADRT